MDSRIIIKKVKVHRGYCYTLECIFCHKKFELKGFKFNEGKGKYCSLECANKCPKRVKNLKNALPNMRGDKNPNYKNGRTMYRYIKKNHCEVCGITLEELKSKKKYKIHPLHIHHKDTDYNNTSLLNLIVVCNSCHRKIHYKMLK